MYKLKPQGWLRHIDFIILDLVSLVLGFAAAYGLRTAYSPVSSQEQYTGILMVYLLADLLLLVCGGLLRRVLQRGYYQEFVHTLRHIAAVELVVVFFMFLTQTGTVYSRAVIFMTVILYGALSYALRVLWKGHLGRKKATADVSALYIISTRAAAETVVEGFREGSYGQYQLCGLCVADADCRGEELAGLQVDATLDTVLEQLQRRWVDEVYISLPVGTVGLHQLVSRLVEMGVMVHQEIPRYPELQHGVQVVEKLLDKTVLTVGINAATPKQAAIKRAIDIAAGLAGCLITVLLTVIIGPIIYIRSPGPIFFAQTRIGKNGKKFKMYKFRSMYLDAEERKAQLMQENRVKDGMMFKLDFDPRIIGSRRLPDGTVKKGIGNYIRDWSLDEFPQFFNVLMGTMSLVGTRPPTEDEWNKYELHHRARLAFKPGITGMWQVSGRSNITDFEEVVRLDKQYIENWSMGLDFRILFQTFKAVLGKDGSM